MKLGDVRVPPASLESHPRSLSSRRRFAAMVKAQCISRDSALFTKAGKGHIAPLHANLDPTQHPLERAREYKRALNAVKLDKHFAKPFVAALSAHVDSVACLAKSHAHIATLVSGACDGQVVRWNLSSKKNEWQARAHPGAFVRGIAFSHQGHHFVSASDDKTVKLWSSAPQRNSTDPLATYLRSHAFTDVDHHWREHQFATAGQSLLLWDTSRSEPLNSFEWGADTVTRIRFNPAQHNLVGCLSADRGVVLYDMGSGSALQKMTMQTRANALCWNPMEPMHFTLASEDHDLYTFDMRKLDHAICNHAGHVNAVLDVDYSPTGTSFVSASYDKTIRLWNVNEKSSYQIYHAKRMQRLFCVRWSADAAHIFSGSDDTNVRIWRAVANEGPGVDLPREKRKRDYSKTLVEKFQHLPEIKRIKNHVHLPHKVKRDGEIKETVRNTQRKREKNRRAHSAKGSVLKVQRKKKQVWRVDE